MKITVISLQKKVPVNPLRIKRTVLKALVAEGVKQAGEIEVVFVSDKLIKNINKRFLGEALPTDVITFDLSGSNKEIFAEIVVSVDTAIRQAKYFQTRVSSELMLYVVHGVLHALGYNDKTARQRKIMDQKAQIICR